MAKRSSSWETFQHHLCPITFLLDRMATSLWQDKLMRWLFFCEEPLQMSHIFFYFSWYNWKHQNKWVPVGFVVDAKVFCLQIQIWNTAANVSAFYNKYLKGSEQDLVRYYRYVLPVLPFNLAACILLSSSLHSGH